MEETYPGDADELGDTVLDPQHRPLTQSRDRTGVFLVELPDSLLARLPHMARRKIGVELVWVDLKGNQTERLEGQRFDDRLVGLFTFR